jgi:thioredoxin reductase
LADRARRVIVVGMASDWDCIVVGGGAAGLSAALVLGRARRRTLLVDAGAPSNAAAHGIGGLLGWDGRPPAELYAAGRAELARYPAVEVRAGTVEDGERRDGAFALTLADGTTETARRVLLAPGMDYRYAELPGAAERWGGTVFHCPFCHGWEVQGRSLGVLDPGPSGVHRAILLRAWSDDVTLLGDGPAALDDEQAAQLRAAGVTVDERPVAGLRGPGTELEAVVFADGSERAIGGLLVAVTLHQRSPLAERLGAAVVEGHPLATDAVEVSPVGATSVAGLLAAGDTTGNMPSVANAIAAGSTAAAGLVGGLMVEDAGRLTGAVGGR